MNIKFDKKPYNNIVFNSFRNNKYNWNNIIRN